MIPQFQKDSGNLPPGIYGATWPEFYERFGYTERRRMLADKLALAIEHLTLVGCRRMYVDGVEVEVLKGNLVSVYRGRMATTQLEAWRNGIAAAKAKGDKQAEKEMTVFARRIERKAAS